MLCIIYIVLFIGGYTAALALWHWSLHAVVSLTQLSLALFCVINVLINVWELALLQHIKRIKHRSDGLLKRLERGTLPPLFLFKHMNLCDALTLRGWSEIWVVYSLMDTSYANSDSFGWTIDVGNGMSSLLPSVLWCVCATNHALLPPKVLGIIGLMSFWQMLYGTILYFFQYCYHRRWERHGNTAAQIFVLVGLSNVTWILFPAFGILTCSRMILADTDAEAWAWLL